MAERKQRRLVRDADLAEYTGIPRGTWLDWRYRRIGPPYIKVGRHVLYDADEVDRWLAARRVLPGGAA